MRANIRPYDQAVELMTPASTLVAERDGEMVGLAIGGVLDIEFAAGKAAQHAFEREHFEGHTHRATQEEFLTAIRSTRPSLSRRSCRRSRTTRPVRAVLGLTDA